MERKLVILVRHGESEKNVINLATSGIEGWPLTPKGREMAEDAGRRLEVLKSVDSLYSSPILRAVETAQIIGKYIGISKPTIDYRLRERHWGILEGKTEPSNPEWKFDKGNRIEPWDETRQKMESFIKDSKGSVVVAVTHGDNMSAACDAFDNKGERIHAVYCPRPCHFTIIEVNGKGLIEKDAMRIPMELL